MKLFTTCFIALSIIFNGICNAQIIPQKGCNYNSVILGNYTYSSNLWVFAPGDSVAFINYFFGGGCVPFCNCTITTPSGNHISLGCDTSSIYFFLPGTYNINCYNLGGGSGNVDYNIQFQTATLIAENNEIKYSVYPNPAQDYINISFISPIANSSICTIYNSIGELVFKKEINKADLTENILINFLVPGMYTIEIKNPKDKLGNYSRFVKM